MFSKMRLPVHLPCRRFPAVRLLICLIVLITLIGPSSVRAAGLYSHTWYVERAIQRLAANGGYSDLAGILTRELATVHYGTLFPDSQGLPLDQEWGEIAHDTVFVRAAYGNYLTDLTAKGLDKDNIDLQNGYYAAFLRATQPIPMPGSFRSALINRMMIHIAHPRDQYDERQIAFLFGVIAHQEADIPWHWDSPTCSDPNASGIGWGVECEAINNYACSGFTCELDLDKLLRHYDEQEHLVYFDYFNIAKPTVYQAVDAAGIRRPNNIPIVCPWPFFDPLDCGQTRLTAGWSEANNDGGANDIVRDMVVTHVPGGIEYGSALVAAAWMNTWIQVGQHTETYLPLLSLH